MPSKSKQKTKKQEYTLDRLLIALQKSISRVNEKSAKVPQNKARAIITGNIGFNISCICTLIADDKLELCEQGIEINLNGHINPDIDTLVLEEEENDTPNSNTKKKQKSKKKTKS